MFKSELVIKNKKIHERVNICMFFLVIYIFFYLGKYIKCTYSVHESVLNDLVSSLDAIIDKVNVTDALLWV